MTKYDQEFLAKLKQLCLEYDSKVGLHPESDLEGCSIYCFALDEANLFKQCSEFKDGVEYVKDLEKLRGKK